MLLRNKEQVQHMGDNIHFLSNNHLEYKTFKTRFALVEALLNIVIKIAGKLKLNRKQYLQCIIIQVDLILKITFINLP